MKKYLLGVFAIALAVGFSSFGTSSTTAKSKEYFAVKNGTSFVWQQAQPSDELFECVTNRTPYCQITVADNFTPIDGQVPAAQDLISHSEVSSQYELIP